MLLVLIAYGLGEALDDDKYRCSELARYWCEQKHAFVQVRFGSHLLVTLTILLIKILCTGSISSSSRTRG